MSRGAFQTSAQPGQALDRAGGGGAGRAARGGQGAARARPALVMARSSSQVALPPRKFPASISFVLVRQNVPPERSIKLLLDLRKRNGQLPSVRARNFSRTGKPM